MSEELEQLQRNFETLMIERNQLFDKRAPIDKQLERNYKALEKAKDKLGEAKAKKGFSIAELVRYDRGNDSQPLYKARKEFATKFGLNASGYLPATETNGLCTSGFSTCFYLKN